MRVERHGRRENGSPATPQPPPAAPAPFAESRILTPLQIQFNDQPDVYNRFLDVMKEFKGQV